MANVRIKLDFGKFSKKLKAAINDVLDSRGLKNLVEVEAIKAIEKVITDNQDLFRPDKGDDLGGNLLVGLLGIGEGGHVDEQKVTTAWDFLLPKRRGENKNLRSEFSQRAKSFGSIEYTIDFGKFYKSPKSTYVSQKEGEPDIVIEWMRNLIEGIPTTKLRPYPPGTEFVFQPSHSGRTGQGRMVDAARFHLPPRQFDFHGRGSNEIFNKITADLTSKLNSPSFRGQITKAINKAFKRL